MATVEEELLLLFNRSFKRQLEVGIRMRGGKSVFGIPPSIKIKIRFEEMTPPYLVTVVQLM